MDERFSFTKTYDYGERTFIAAPNVESKYGKLPGYKELFIAIETEYWQKDLFLALPEADVAILTRFLNKFCEKRGIKLDD